MPRRLELEDHIEGLSVAIGVDVNPLRAQQYLPAFFAGDYLVPAVGHMRAQLTALHVGGEAQRRDLASNLEQLPYALGAAYLAVSECVHVMAMVADAHAPVGDEFVVVPEDQRFMVGYKVDAFLDAARRAQNALIFYWSRALRLPLGKSLAALAEDVQKGRSRLPPSLQSVVADYWFLHGSRVKTYRDLCQHFAVVISDVRVLRARSGFGEPLVFAALPTDPSVTSADRLAYTSPVVLALDFIVEELVELLRFVNAAMRPLLLPRSQFQPIRRLIMRSAVRNEKDGDPLGSRVPTQEQLRSKVRRIGPELALGPEFKKP